MWYFWMYSSILARACITPSLYLIPIKCVTITFPSDTINVKGSEAIFWAFFFEVGNNPMTSLAFTDGAFQ